MAVVVADVIDQLLWVETDRGAIYQLQNGTTWQYLAGTMWGTLSPDQRPTDLGTHDAGFDFRGTDQQREFIWSQTAWVETTSISGAVNLTHPNVVTKVGAAGQIVEGGITDASAGNSGHVQIATTGYVGFGTGTAVPSAPVTVWGVFNTPSLTHLSPNNHAVGGIGAQELAVFIVNGAPFPVCLQTRHTISDGFSYPICLNPLGGNVGIALTNPSFLFQLGADSAGKPSTSTWSVVSDLRLKQNIKPVKDDSLSILNKLDWIRFEYNGLANMPRGEKAIGLAAQELQLQLPEAVRSTKTKLNETDAEETDVMAIDYHHIIVHSARAIQQLNAEVQALRALIGKP